MLNPKISPRLALALALAVTTGLAQAGPVRSVGILSFADADTVVISDWRAGELHAVRLPPLQAASGSTPFNLKNVSAPIAKALHAQPDALRFEGMAFRPGSGVAYITLSVGTGGKTPRPALVTVDASNRVGVVDLARLPHTSAAIQGAPAADKRLWRELPQATLTVTSMLSHQGKLYVAGLSDASFASTLRVYDFPFTAGGRATATSIEMYHAVHNELETRAPIRAMAIATLNGEPSLVAAYTCTPLVTIALKELTDGAHVTGKTIAELGWGSEPVDMVSFDAGDGPVILLANTHKAADLMSVASIAEAAAKPGLSTPIQWPAQPLLGLKSTYVPLPGVARLVNQDKAFLAALRRNEASGAMELVSLRKGAFLRVSDFVNEYDFADFRYPPGDAFKGVHKLLRTDEGFPDLAKRAE